VGEDDENRLPRLSYKERREGGDLVVECLVGNKKKGPVTVMRRENSCGMPILHPGKGEKKRRKGILQGIRGEAKCPMQKGGYPSSAALEGEWGNEKKRERSSTDYPSMRNLREEAASAPLFSFLARMKCSSVAGL